MKRIHVLILGEVQGVGFRAFVLRRAKELNLRGFVRNTLDGAVEAVFVGEKENIQKILVQCKLGPFMAQIKDIKIREEEVKYEFDDFEVRA